MQALVGISFFIFVSTASANAFDFSISGTSSSATVIVNVIDGATQAPLAAAAVTLATTTGSGSVQGTTNASGAVALARPGPLFNVSVQVSGYSAMTLVGVPGSSVSINLKKAAAPSILASGTMTGFPGLTADDEFLGTVKFGLVFKTLSASDFLDFSLSSLISPLSDTIDVDGQHQIPSNIVLPKQSLVFGTIQLNKPLYRFPLNEGSVTLVGFQGEVDASDLSGGVDVTILNKLNITKLALAPTSAETTDFTENLDANVPVKAAFSVTPQAAPFDADIVVVSAIDQFGDRTEMIPADAKCAYSVANKGSVQTVALNSATFGTATAKDDVAALAMTSDGTRISGIISPADPSQSKMTLGAFLNTPALASGTIPPTVHVTSVPHQIQAVVATDSSQNTMTTYVLPGTAAADALVPSASVSYSVISLEFDSAFDGTQVDGTTIMTRLQRFSRSTASLKPAP